MSDPKTSVKVSTDVLGVGRAVDATLGWIPMFLVILFMGDCAGCIDTADIIRAIRGCP